MEFSERRIKKVYSYKNGLTIMTFSDGKDAVAFDPPRMAFWTFEKATEAFEFAKTGILPSVTKKESIPTIYIDPATPLPARTGASTGYAASSLPPVRGSRIKDNTKKVIIHDDQIDYIPVESTEVLN